MNETPNVSISEPGREIARNPSIVDYSHAADHMHDEATKIEEQAIKMMKEGLLHEGYQALRVSSPLRIAANYLTGVKAS